MVESGLPLQTKGNMRNRLEAPFTPGTEMPEAANAAQGICVGAGSRPVGRTQLGFFLFF